MILMFIFCTKEKNPLSPTSNLGHSKLSLQTDKTTYSWQPNEENRIIVIQGELQNNSTETYYSQVGDAFAIGESDLLLFAENSASCLEKFDESENKWCEIHLLGILIEGSKFVPLYPSKTYSINATLFIVHDKYKQEVGKFRLRIDYYDSPNDVGKVNPYSDYSNSFEIKAN